MKVCLVCNPEANSWILGKMARKLQEELVNVGIDANISDHADPNAAVNHYMLYLDYNPSQSNSIDTLMITHVDRREKLEWIKAQMVHAKVGICMSDETMYLLIDSGIDAQKLCYINPAHDSVIKPRKIRIGIASKVYADGRKREQFLKKLADMVDPNVFSFKIMGEGWEEIVEYLKNKTFEVSYYNQFDYETYVNLIPELDYYLYTGQDEGSMGFVDALSAGVKTIVTPQGFHLDVPSGITHAFNTTDELIQVFKKIDNERKTIIESVQLWTWKHYALKHIEVWKYVCYGSKINSRYSDGLSSLLKEKVVYTNRQKRLKTKYKIFLLTFSRFLHSKDKLGKIKRKIGLS